MQRFEQCGKDEQTCRSNNLKANQLRANQSKVQTEVWNQFIKNH